MSWPARVYKVLIASPLDVPDERAALPEIIHTWNSLFGEHYGVIFQPVMWETHSRPTMGTHPQAALNAQIVDSCDVVIATFWTRLGTQTEEAASGTVEEIERCVQAGKEVMVYFSNAPVRPDSIDPEEYERLKEFKEKCQRDGLYDEYESVGELREEIGRHLSILVKDLVGARDDESPSTSEAKDTTTAEKAQANALADQLRTFVAEVGAQWRAEKASDPVSSEGGKAMIARAFAGLVSFAGARLVSENDALRDEVDGLMTHARALQNHQMYIDGGVSWKAFWDGGDELMAAIASLPVMMES